MSFLKRLVPLKANVTLDYQNEDIGSSHRLKGYARLESEDNFKVEQVRLEIRVNEVYRHSSRRYNSSTKKWENYTATENLSLYSKDIPISESFEASKGFKQDFPFEFEIPDYDAAHGEAVWNYVKAVVNVKSRPDLTQNKNYIR